MRFEPLALALNQNWMPLTMTIYAADALDSVEQTHAALFKAIYENNHRPQSTEDLADFYAEHEVIWMHFYANLIRLAPKMPRGAPGGLPNKLGCAVCRRLLLTGNT